MYSQQYICKNYQENVHKVQDFNNCINPEVALDLWNLCALKDLQMWNEIRKEFCKTWNEK